MVSGIGQADATGLTDSKGLFSLTAIELQVLPAEGGQQDESGSPASQPCKRRVSARRVQQAIELAAERSAALEQASAAESLFAHLAARSMSDSLVVPAPVHNGFVSSESSLRIRLRLHLGRAPPA